MTVTCPKGFTFFHHAPSSCIYMYKLTNQWKTQRFHPCHLSLICVSYFTFEYCYSKHVISTFALENLSDKNQEQGRHARAICSSTCHQHLFLSIKKSQRRGNDNFFPTASLRQQKRGCSPPLEPRAPSSWASSLMLLIGHQDK